MTDHQDVVSTEIAALKRLTRDIREAARTLTTDEVRYLVWQYYAQQHLRIAGGHQKRQLDRAEKPHETIDFFAHQFEVVEKQIVGPLNEWSDAQPLGVWAKTVTGIGPVIAAGLLAHIDIEKSPTVGHIWAFAGLDPTRKWEKGRKRPYNAELKTLCAYKMGESFVKVQNNKSDVYGKIFAERKRIEIEANERHAYAAMAAVKKDTVDKKTDAYKHYAAGMLPPAHIHARARRYAVKLFLAHYHLVGYFLRYGVLPPMPYIFTQMPDHVHFIKPPHSEIVPGLDKALKKLETKLRKRE